MKRIITLLAVSFFFTASLALAGPVKIGMITTLSTKAGYLGEEIRDGFQLAIDQENGKLGGIPVDLLVDDDGHKPEKAKQIADRLIVLLEGNARSYRPGQDQVESRESVLTHGDHMGSEGLLTISRHGRSAVMTTDGTLAVLDKRDFIRLVRRTPSIAMNLPGMSTLKVILPFFFDKSAIFYMPSLAMNRPRLFIYMTLVTTLLLLVPAIVPNVLPGVFPFLSPLKVDTNPENMLAADELRQVTLFLFRITVAPDLVDAEIGVGAVGQPDRGRRAADLLDRDAMGEIAHAGSTIVRIGGDAQETEFSKFRP